MTDKDKAMSLRFALTDLDRALRNLELAEKWLTRNGEQEYSLARIAEAKSKLNKAKDCMKAETEVAV